MRGKKLVDPLGLVPDEAKTGVNTSKTNIDGKTVEVGTFNMEWLGCDEARMFFKGKPTGAQPRTEQDYQKMADAIKQSGAEVMAVQEISDEKALQKVLGNLPGYDYILGTTGKRDDGKNQMVGIIYNGDKVECDKSSVTEIMEAQVPHLAGDGHLRAPLAAKFKSKEGGFDFTIVSMHLKAGQKGNCRQIRDAQVSVINKWAQDRMASDGDKDIVFAGDFNDTLNSSTTKKLGEGTDLHMVTSESAIRDEWSHPVTHRLIDHIGVTTANGGSLEEYIPGTTGVVKEKVSSDHRPVVSSFKDVDND
jgi:predicted extracellular nuclease